MGRKEHKKFNTINVVLSHTFDALPISTLPRYFHWHQLVLTLLQPSSIPCFRSLVLCLSLPFLSVPFSGCIHFRYFSPTLIYCSSSLFSLYLYTFVFFPFYVYFSFPFLSSSLPYVHFACWCSISDATYVAGMSVVMSFIARSICFSHCLSSVAPSTLTS